MWKDHLASESEARLCLLLMSIGVAAFAVRGKWLFWVVFTTFTTALTPAGKRVKVSRRLREHVLLCLNRIVSISVTI